MHQTTVRFGPDLWEALEAECVRLGVSAAQFLREAALARLAYTAGQRGDLLYDVALATAGVTTPALPVGLESLRTASSAIVTPVENSRLETSAVAAQGRRARARSVELRAEAAALRARRPLGRSRG